MEQSVKRTCRTCGYFRQHYIWFQRYEAIALGHCVHPPSTRKCRPDMIACPKWIPQSEEYRQYRIPPE